MQRQALMGATVAVAVLLAASVFATQRPTAEEPPEPVAAERPSVTQKTPRNPEMPPLDAGGPRYRELSGGVPYGSPGGGAPVPSDPDASFEIALTQIVEPIGLDDEMEAGRYIQQQLRRVAESVELAVAAQHDMAQADPSTAELATERAATLYEHGADQFRSVDIPPTLTGTDATRFRAATDKMASRMEGQAERVREQGILDAP